MKVKNIMFSGFAAAIFAGVCGAAEAAVTYELTSKSYVDTELEKKQDNLTAGTGIDITNNVVKSTLDLTPFATTTDMQAADQALQGKIDDEASARANADSTLEGKITAMDAAYKLADTGLQSQIDAVKQLTGNEGVADQISAAVSAEATARAQADAQIRTDFAAADSTLDGKITAEATARENADTAMAEDIADLVEADTALDGKITAEATTRAQADTALENAYKAADSTLDGKITAMDAAYKTADAQVLADAKADATTKADAVKDLVNAGNFVSANGILTTKGGYLVLSDGQGNVSLSQVAVVNGDGSKDMITGDSLN